MKAYTHSAFAEPAYFSKNNIRPVLTHRSLSLGRNFGIGGAKQFYMLHKRQNENIFTLSVVMLPSTG